jgi:monoamine oxidase
VAVPIATLGKIKFETISPGKKLLIDNQLDNVMARQAMIFKKPFWRPSHCGYVNFSHEFIMNELVDLTPHDGSVGILGFVFLGDGFKNWQA